MSSNFVGPTQQKNLRACMVCSVVQLQTKFMREGCPNCEDFLGLAGHSEAIEECTSQVYEGLITLADPTTSWVAKWQRLDGYVSGVYAVKLPEEKIQEIEEAGVRYVPRDGSENQTD